VGFVSLLAADFQSKVISNGGYTTTLSAYGANPQLSLSVIYRLEEDVALRYSFTRVVTRQVGTFSGSVIGDVIDDEEFYHFGVGLMKHLFKVRGKFRPYAEVDVGYSLASGLYTISNIGGIFSGLNGGVDVSAGGVFLGLRLGADWQISEKVTVVPEVSYVKTYYKEGTVNATTTTMYSQGQRTAALNDTRLSISVGVRYWL
jgi:hypothetical protein